VLKTMWNMPAQLLRRSADDIDGDDEPLAAGSLTEMVDAFGERDEVGTADLIIKCAGRDRPISAEEIRDLRSTSVSRGTA
jgi:hypothetical protein